MIIRLYKKLIEKISNIYVEKKIDNDSDYIINSICSLIENYNGTIIIKEKARLLFTGTYFGTSSNPIVGISDGIILINKRKEKNGKNILYLSCAITVPLLKYTFYLVIVVNIMVLILRIKFNLFPDLLSDLFFINLAMLGFYMFNRLYSDNKFRYMINIL